MRFDRYSLAISESHVSPRVNAAYRLSAGTLLFGSYNHFYVPPPVENVLASSAGLTSLVSEIGRPLPPVRAIKENQFELGVTQPIAGVMTLGVTSYYRLSDDPPHTTLFPDSRFYTYASFDKGKAYGMEIKADIPQIADLGVSAFLNYALGRVWFYNPIHAGFTTEAAHLSDSSRFLAPMDQTHTLTSGLRYHNSRTRLWGALAFEYGSGTPGSHGGGDRGHDDGAVHEHASGPGLCGTRCPSHFTQDVSIGWDATESGNRAKTVVSVQCREPVEQGPSAVEGEHDGAGAVLESTSNLGVNEDWILTCMPSPFVTTTNVSVLSRRHGWREPAILSRCRHRVRSTLPADLRQVWRVPAFRPAHSVLHWPALKEAPDRCLFHRLECVIGTASLS